MNRLLTKRLIGTPAGEWRRDDLAHLSGGELRDLALLLGVPHSGTKAVLVNRLLDLGRLRGLLHEYEDADVRGDAERLANTYFKRELKGMAAMAKLWKSGTKIQLALGLLQWRNECRRRGQEVYRRSVEALRSRPRQLALRFESGESGESVGAGLHDPLAAVAAVDDAPEVAAARRDPFAVAARGHDAVTVAAAGDDAFSHGRLLRDGSGQDSIRIGA